MSQESSLSTGTSSGSQNTTASPQTSAAGGGGFVPVTQNVQPVSSNSLLEAQGGGTPLNPNAPLTVVNLANTTTSTAATGQKPTNQHHVNPALLGFGIVLAAVAIAVFVQMTRSAKNTTNY